MLSCSLARRSLAEASPELGEGAQRLGALERLEHVTERHDELEPATLAGRQRHAAVQLDQPEAHHERDGNGEEQRR